MSRLSKRIEVLETKMGVRPSKLIVLHLNNSAGLSSGRQGTRAGRVGGAQWLDRRIRSGDLHASHTPLSSAP
jgi:hypothetical protein